MKTKHQRTLDLIFQHPLAHNLGWDDAEELLAQVGQVTHARNGNLKVSVGARTTVFPPRAPHENLSPGQVAQFRRLLRGTLAIKPASGTRRQLVVIDLMKARVFELGDTTEPMLVTNAYEHTRKQRSHSAHTYPEDNPRPVLGPFFADVAGLLAPDSRVVLFGGGKGSSNVAERFADWIEEERPELAARLVGVETVDVTHMADGELVDRARREFAD